jgi:hypothetical protein
MSHKINILRSVLAGVVAIGLAVSGASASYATEASPQPATSAIAAAPVAPGLTTAQDAQVKQIQQLRIGGSTSIPGANGSEVNITKTSSGYSVAIAGISGGAKVSPSASFCRIAIAAAIIGIGAAALGVLAAVTGGGTAVIAGVVLTGAQIGVLAAVATSYTAVLTFVSLYIC